MYRAAGRLIVREIITSSSISRRALFSTVIAPSLNNVMISDGHSGLTRPEFPHTSEHHRVSLLVEILNVPGSLVNVLLYFSKHDIDLTCIESRPTSADSSTFMVYIDFAGLVGEKKTDKLLDTLKATCRSVLILDEREVPWFPRHVSELDKIANKVMEAGKDIEADHPGFLDSDYRERRGVLAGLAMTYRFGNPLPVVQYTDEENATWGLVYDRLQAVQRKHACAEYLTIMPLMVKHCGYCRDTIPQARDISDFLEKRTGFRLRPVAGLLTSRDFLNALAFRMFFSTQYIRHSSRPFYTPEPDICHELLGHAPMFADPDFASFSQEIGLASLGASDADIKRLATCYWHSVEFGLVREGKEIKAYGAGLLSSFGELEYACQPPTPVFGNPDLPRAPQLVPWDPETAARTSYPITSYQPTYFVAESVSDAKAKLRKFCEKLPRPFYACYNPQTSSIWVDRAVQTLDRDDL